MVNPLVKIGLGVMGEFFINAALRTHPSILGARVRGGVVRVDFGAKPLPHGPVLHSLQQVRMMSSWQPVTRAGQEPNEVVENRKSARSPMTFSILENTIAGR